MASPEDRRHIERLVKEHTARLKQLELRKARQGDAADPSVGIEIEDLKAIIADLSHHQPSDKAIEARQVLRNQYDSDMDFLMADGAARNRRQTRIEERQDVMATELHDLKSKVLVVIDEFRSDKSDAVRGRRRNFRLQLASIALSVIVLGAFLWLVLWR